LTTLDTGDTLALSGPGAEGPGLGTKQRVSVPGQEQSGNRPDWAKGGSCRLGIDGEEMGSGSRGTREITLKSTVAISEDAVFKELDGEAVILNLESRTYFGLNAVGTRVWTLLQEHGSLDDVFQALCQEFEVDPAVLERDLVGLVEQMRAKGLVNVAAAE
jgi:coenzyme PQQ synthesis protein D (PqqD)